MRKSLFHLINMKGNQRFLRAKNKVKRSKKKKGNKNKRMNIYLE